MLRIVSQAIPPDNREATYQCFVKERRAALEQAVAAPVSADASLAERGRAILIVANEACRLALAATLQATATGHPAQVRVDGVLYPRHHEGTVVYHSLCGPFHVRRATHREVHERNGPTVVPLEFAAGLIEGATPTLEYRVALGVRAGARAACRGADACGRSGSRPRAAPSRMSGQSDRDADPRRGAADRSGRATGGGAATASTCDRRRP